MSITIDTKHLLFFTAVATITFLLFEIYQSATPLSPPPQQDVEVEREHSPVKNENNSIKLFADTSPAPSAPTAASNKASSLAKTQSNEESVVSMKASPYDIKPIEDPSLQKGDNFLPRQLASIEETFQQEVYDPQWAVMIESQTWETFYAAELDHSDIESVDCRTSVCKIIVTHENESAEQTFKQALLAEAGNTQGYLHSDINEHGTITTTLFRLR